MHLHLDPHRLLRPIDYLAVVRKMVIRGYSKRVLAKRVAPRQKTKTSDFGMKIRPPDLRRPYVYYL